MIVQEGDTCRVRECSHTDIYFYVYIVYTSVQVHKPTIAEDKETNGIYLL